MLTAPWLQKCLQKSRKLNSTLQHTLPEGEELGWAIVRGPQIRVTLAYLAASTDIKCRWSPTRALSFVYYTKGVCACSSPHFISLQTTSGSMRCILVFNCLPGFCILTHNLCPQLLVSHFFSSVLFLPHVFFVHACQGVLQIIFHTMSPDAHVF